MSKVIGRIFKKTGREVKITELKRGDVVTIWGQGSARYIFTEDYPQEPHIFLGYKLIKSGGKITRSRSTVAVELASKDAVFLIGRAKVFVERTVHIFRMAKLVDPKDLFIGHVLQDVNSKKYLAIEKKQDDGRMLIRQLIRDRRKSARYNSKGKVFLSRIRENSYLVYGEIRRKFSYNLNSAA